MNTKILMCAVIAAAPLLRAQHEMPDPKTPAHQALAMLAGHWETSCKMNAVPGVPCADNATESRGREHAELICNGLWLKTTSHGTYQGQSFESVWLAGYDPVEKKYKSIWVSNHDSCACAFDGSYDPAAKTWTFTGSSPKGSFRSVYVFQDADNSTETCYAPGEDGKEVQVMQLTRRRSKSAPDATEGTLRAKSGPVTAEQSLLADTVGSWRALVTHGKPPVEEKCVEKIVFVCGGRWIWSSFTGELSGVPIDGHALLGYDVDQKEFVSFFFDTFSARHARMSGTHDAAKGVLTLEGTCPDDQGRPTTIRQVWSQRDKDTRSLEMTVKAAGECHGMKIAYERIDG